MLHAWFPGQEGGTAIAEILFGDTNPSGKLPATFERKWEDNAAFGNYPGQNDVVHYAEGLYFGYRHFDKKNLEPLFCFGHGLSYTTFTIENAKAERTGDTVKVTADVTNTGQRPAEVVQAYVGKKDSSIDRPVKILAGFTRVTLQPGEKKTVTIEIRRDQLSYYDVATHDWKIEPGAYQITVGDSSRNLPAQERRVTNASLLPCQSNTTDSRGVRGSRAGSRVTYSQQLRRCHKAHLIPLIVSQICVKNRIQPIPQNQRIRQPKVRPKQHFLRPRDIHNMPNIPCPRPANACIKIRNLLT